jgi:hypothetical protein
MELSGTVQAMVRHQPILGEPIDRAMTHLERMETSMFRGLIRASALDQTGGLESTDYESFAAFHVLMAELLLQGEFRFVAGPTYYKRLHGANLHLKWYNWPEEDKLEAWALMAAQMAEVIVPAGASTEARRQLFDTVLARFVVAREGRWMFFEIKDNRQARQAFLDAAFNHLMRRGRFDTAACLGMSLAAFRESSVTALA